MAEVGRVPVCDPAARLPGGFWAAVAVWLERPQVANKRLCGALLEARRSAALPRVEARGAGVESVHGQSSPEGHSGHGPELRPEKEERDAARRGLQEGPEPGQSSSEGDHSPGPELHPEQKERDAARSRLQEGPASGQNSPEGDHGPGPSADPEQEEWDAAQWRPQGGPGPGPGQGSPGGDPGPGPDAGPGQEKRDAAQYRPQKRQGPGQGAPEGDPDPRPKLGPEQSTGRRGLEEAQSSFPQAKEQREAAAAPLLAGDAGQPRKAGGAEGDVPAADLDSLWEHFSQSLADGNPDLLAFLTRSGAGSQPEEAHQLDLVLRTVIPKTNPHCSLTAPRREVVVQDVPNGTVTFLPLEEDKEGKLEVKISNVYQIQLIRGKAEWFISVLIFCPERWHSDGVIYPKPTWLGEELLVRLARWSVEKKKSEFKSTLSLISILRYSKAYQELKEKYKEMVKVWPEVTDPEKFVYEDVAIAAYLLILWEEERAERGVTSKQSFVDLGCGNGLLVHILCSEGHPGRGIDVRRRKIWDMYGPHARLEEDAVTPSDETLFPDVDWLIGNHSDELTPWIPVIAARSSYDCRFFVLPCCFFDFAGRYHRRQSQKTQYREYLDFIQEVGLACGFHVEEDCLRIPSTKRVCLIGKSRRYPPTEEARMDEQRTCYLRSRRGRPGSPPGRDAAPVAAGSGGHREGLGALDVGAECVPEAQAAERGAGAQAGGLWLPGFHPREKAERVRNCGALPRDFIDRVVLQVANLLLSGKEHGAGESREGSLKTWNGGGSLSLAEVAGELDRETLQRLKRECGGLQTLLRNSHQVFEVLNGRVHIRDWRRELQRERPPGAKRGLSSEAFKTRVCWFFTHHPDGCALPSASCPFAHGPGELRPPQTSKKKRQDP